VKTTSHGKPASGTLTIKIGGRKQNGKEKKTENETTA
jgi:hypothetical protein